MTKKTYQNHPFKSELHVINAIGPFVHGVWSNGENSIGDEEALNGRSRAILENFTKLMLATFDLDEIKKMSLADLGCYDGFLTCEIEKVLPFKKIIGIEPRLKNIEKGIGVRKFLNIDTNIEFRQGDIKSAVAEAETFDIVFCSGVFHHIENITEFFRSIKLVSNKAIFIEGQVYAFLTENRFFHSLVSNFNTKIIEPKDAVYNFVPKLVGICGQKLETNYLDGSADALSLVSIPSIDSLKLSLITAGFSEPKVTLNPLHYRKKISSQLRDFRSACVFSIVAETNNLNSTITHNLEIYDKAMISTVLSKELLTRLGMKERNQSIYGKVLKYFIANKFGRKLQYFISLVISMIEKDSLRREIISSIKYKADDKLQFEFAKYKLSIGDIVSASQILYEIVSKINCDWRVTYRSFVLLSLINKEEEKFEEYKYFYDLVLKANSNFPVNILESSLIGLFPNIYKS
ncbi:class I SAM-dependent methyltransferase [Amylibacter sp.]|nr:class I SAM-dependent methyltransferase [Amylibacter sp.]